MASVYGFDSAQLPTQKREALEEALLSAVRTKPFIDEFSLEQEEQLKRSLVIAAIHTLHPEWIIEIIST